MINWKIIWKIIGHLLYLEAALMALCSLMAFLYGEDDFSAFLIAVVTTMATGACLHFIGRDSTNTMSRRDSILVVTLAWMISASLDPSHFYTAAISPISLMPTSKPCQVSPPLVLR